MAVWFDLHLFADISISTSPSWDLSWEQAIFPIYPAPSWSPPREGEEEGEVCLGDVLVLNASCSDTQLEIGVEVDLAEQSVAHQKPDVNPLPVFYVERSDLLRLNDSHYTSSYQQALVKALADVRAELSGSEGGDRTEPSGAAECLVLDLCEGVSLFGLAAAKSGID